MSHEPKPSEHAIAAMQIAFPYSKEYAENNPRSETADWFARMAAQFDQHAIAPAVAERDRRIAELEAIVRAAYLYVLNRLPEEEQWQHGEDLSRIGTTDSAKAAYEAAKSERSAP